MPQACASTGTIPKSSTPGSRTAVAASVQVANLLVAAPAEELDVGGRPGAASRGLFGASPDDFEGHADSPAGLDRHVDPLVRHQRGHDEEAAVDCRADRWSSGR